MKGFTINNYHPVKRFAIYGNATIVPIILPTFASATTISSLMTLLFQNSFRLSILLRFLKSFILEDST